MLPAHRLAAFIFHIDKNINSNTAKIMNENIYYACMRSV